MTSYLIDINVWLALMWEDHPNAGPAEKWLTSIPERQVRMLFCRMTQLGLMRLLTNQKIMGESVLNVGEAIEALDRWRDDPRVELAGEPPGVEAALRGALKRVANERATKAIMDAYLAAFAEMLGATLVTFDQALHSMAGAKRTPSIHLPHQ